MSDLRPGQFEIVVLHFGYPAITLDDEMPTRSVAEKYAAMLIGHKVSDVDPETLVVTQGRIVSTYLKNSLEDGSKGRVIAICEPVEPRKKPYKPDMEYK